MSSSIIRLINLSEEEIEILDEETIKDIEEAMDDIKAGRVYTCSDLDDVCILFHNIKCAVIHDFRDHRHAGDFPDFC